MNANLKRPVRAPPCIVAAGGESNNGNNHSVILRVDFGEASVLLTGDLEERAIEDLVERYDGTNLLDVDVYQVGHHGSANGTTAELVEAMSPASGPSMLVNLNTASADELDTLGLWLAASPRSARRARRSRKLARQLGLKPGPLHQQAGRTTAKLPRLAVHDVREGVGFRCTLGPLWHRGVDLEARAEGAAPCDLLALLQVAQDVGARVYRLDLALDMLGCSADTAAAFFTPLASRDWLDTTHDFVCLRGEPTRWHREVDHATSYVGNADDPVSVAFYTDMPSKLQPNGPNAFHYEVRVVGSSVPDALRACPLAVFNLLQPHVFFRTLGRFVKRNSLAPVALETVTSKAARVDLIVTDAFSRTGTCRLSAKQIAFLASCTKRTVHRVLADLEGDSVQVLERGGGRGRTTVRTLWHA